MKKLKGSIVVEATVVVPIVVLVALTLIVLMVKEFQTSVDVMKCESAVFLSQPSSTYIRDQPSEFFKCEDSFVYILNGEEGSIRGYHWEQLSEKFKLLDIDLENYTLLELDRSSATDWVTTWIRMFIIRKKGL